MSVSGFSQSGVSSFDGTGWPLLEAFWLTRHVAAAAACRWEKSLLLAEWRLRILGSVHKKRSRIRKGTPLEPLALVWFHRGSAVSPDFSTLLLHRCHLQLIFWIWNGSISESGVRKCFLIITVCKPCWPRAILQSLRCIQMQVFGRDVGQRS